MVTVAQNDDLLIECLELGKWKTNCYIVMCQKTRDSVIIDAPAEVDTISAQLRGSNPRYILLTHNHFDHIGALPELRSILKIPLAAHPLDSVNLSPYPEKQLSEGETVACGNLRLEVLHTPGHTPGSVCFKLGRYLLSGDTIFPGGPGHTRSPSDFREIVKSLQEKIFVLPGDTGVYPGHGASTVLQKEKGRFDKFIARPMDPNLCGDVLWRSPKA